MNSLIKFMKVLLNEDYTDWDNLLKDFNPALETTNISNRTSNINFERQPSKHSYDIFIFDLDCGGKKNLDYIKVLKKNNPDLKTIVYTSYKNRRYRSQLLYKHVEFFLFKETESEILTTVLRQTNMRLSKD